MVMVTIPATLAPVGNPLLMSSIITFNCFGVAIAGGGVMVTVALPATLAPVGNPLLASSISVLNCFRVVFQRA